MTKEGGEEGHDSLTTSLFKIISLGYCVFLDVLDIALNTSSCPPKSQKSMTSNIPTSNILVLCF